MPHLIRTVAGSLIALSLLAVPAAAQYPSRPINLIVPFAAGGPTDVVARLVGDHMSRTLGQTIVVENIGGGGGTIGMTRAAQANPDGYTIAIGNMGTQSASPALHPQLKYDPSRGFAQISVVNHTPQSIVTKKDMPAKNLQELMAHLKANSAKLTYGHAGVGSISHVAGLVFNAQFGLKPTLVPYKGTAPALRDMVAGQIDYMVDQSMNVIPHVKAGTIKAYAVAAPSKLDALPNVPTTKEGGVDFMFSAWNAMVAPKGTPPEIVAKILDALGKALDDPKIRARFAELGSTVPTGADRGPAGLQKLVDSEIARITPVLKAAATK
jgi:tripartite-type tricarboxylate transporter receptor subunit TctC